jgi:16S rRNA (guanine1516-N2)-methyltransferase
MAGKETRLLPDIAVWPASEELISIAQSLADRLHIPLFAPSQPDPQRGTNQLILTVAPHPECEYQLELRDATRKHSKLFIDYAHGEIAYRAQHGGGRRQALAKAVGLKPGYSPNVIDATAGLGRDAFVLANLDCTVTMIERSPIMACLLEDALRRAVYDERLKPWIQQRLQLVIGDARQQIPVLGKTFAADSIYIDPMYPPRGKSALVKKEMRFIQALVGDDMDSEALLAIALQHAKKRVIVKRPSYAAMVAGPQPSHTIESKNTRYDVYMVL